MSGQNPFGDPSTDNPFADSSIRQATDGSGEAVNNYAVNVEDYNPFAADTAASPAANSSPNAARVQQPATPGPPIIRLPPPSYNETANNRTTPAPDNQINAQVEALRKKQQELDAAEERLRKREEEMRSQQLAGPAHAGAAQNNWPPLPGCLPCKPCFYQDIAMEIPEQNRTLCRIMYYIFLGHTVSLMWNLIAGLAYMCVDASSGASVFGMGILFLLLFSPSAYVCWFRPIYRAFRSDSSINYMIFFFVFAVQSLLHVTSALGIPILQMCGWMIAVQVIGSNVVAGIICIISATFFTILAVVDIFFLIKIHKAYRYSGASVEKARAEFAQGVVTNPEVQRAAASSAQAAATGAISGAVSGSNHY